MATAHQHGGGKRSRFFNRLFPWRSSGAGRRSSSGSRMMGTGIGVTGSTAFNRDPSTRLFAGSYSSSYGSSVRRTSPVDLNLGAETAVDETPPVSTSLPLDSTIPATTMPSHPLALGSESGMPIRRPKRHGFNPNVDTRQVRTPAESLTEQIDKEELGALRHLASELHAALRISEEENILLKAKLQTLDDWGLTSEPFLFSSHGEPVFLGKRYPGTSKLDRLIDDLRDIASSQPTSPFSSPTVQRRNIRDLGHILQQRQAELRRLTTELQETQTELLFTKVELEQVRRCLHRLDQRLMCAEDELDIARQGLLQASMSKQRLMQELQTTRGLLMRCWSRVRLLEQNEELGHSPRNALEAS